MTNLFDITSEQTPRSARMSLWYSEQVDEWKPSLLTWISSKWFKISDSNLFWGAPIATHRPHLLTTHSHTHMPTFRCKHNLLLLRAHSEWAKVFSRYELLPRGFPRANPSIDCPSLIIFGTIAVTDGMHTLEAFRPFSLFIHVFRSLAKPHSKLGAFASTSTCCLPLSPLLLCKTKPMPKEARTVPRKRSYELRIEALSSLLRCRHHCHVLSWIKRRIIDGINSTS